MTELQQRPVSDPEFTLILTGEDDAERCKRLILDVAFKLCKEWGADNIKGVTFCGETGKYLMDITSKYNFLGAVKTHKQGSDCIDVELGRKNVVEEVGVKSDSMNGVMHQGFPSQKMIDAVMASRVSLNFKKEQVRDLKFTISIRDLRCA